MKADQEMGGMTSNKCNPNPEIRRIKKKPKHPSQKSTILPAKLRRHFDAYWEICLALGCDQCVETGQILLIEAANMDDEEEEAES